MSDADTIHPGELLSLAEEISGPFPPPRACTELVLLDVNPHRAHAYWHIDGNDYSTARERAPGTPLVIRLHDVTGITFDGGNPHDTHDTVVSGPKGQVDLNVRRDGRTYIAEIGLRQRSGHLERLAISQTIDMPRAPLAQLKSHLMPEPRMREEAPSSLNSANQPVPELPKDWPDADQLSSLIPDRKALVQQWYEKRGHATRAITNAQLAAAAAIENVPATHEVSEQRVSAEKVIAASSQDASGLEFQKLAAAEDVIRLEDYLSYSSHNLGAISEDVSVRVDIAVHGRVPAGRRASLFGNEIPVDAEGHFELRRELLEPGATLPGLFQQSRSTED